MRAVTLSLVLLFAQPGLCARTFGTLVLVEVEEPAGPSPLSAESDAEWRFVELVYAPLYTATAVGGFEPAIASTYGASADGKTLTVTLNDEAVFSTGRPVRARDVVYTYELARAGKWNHAWVDRLRMIDAVEESGEQVVIRLKSRLGQPESVLSVPLIPHGLHGKGADLRPLPLGVIGAGPFKLATETDNSRLVANETSVLAPRIAEVRILSVGTPELALQTVRLMGESVSFVAARLPRTSRELEFSDRTLVDPRLDVLALAFDPQSSLLADPLVRRAVDRVLSRSELFAPDESARAGSAPVGRRDAAYPRDATILERDPVEAQRLLWWEGGWQREPDQPYFVRKGKDGATEELEFTLVIDADDDASRRRARVLEARFAQAGMNLIVDARPRREYESRIRSREFPAALVTITLPGDGDLAGAFHSKGGDRVLKFEDADVDRALDAGDRKTAVQLLTERAPAIFLGTRPRLGLTGGSVQAPAVVGRGGLGRVHKWRVR